MCPELTSHGINRTCLLYNSKICKKCLVLELVVSPGQKIIAWSHNWSDVICIVITSFRNSQSYVNFSSLPSQSNFPLRECKILRIFHSPPILGTHLAHLDLLAESCPHIYVYINRSATSSGTVQTDQYSWNCNQFEADDTQNLLTYASLLFIVLTISFDISTAMVRVAPKSSQCLQLAHYI
jgi:hypothetical protein